MRLLSLVSLISLFILVSCQDKNEKKYRIGVFNLNGVSPVCVTETKEVLKLDPDFEPVVITAVDVLAGKLDELDAVMIPGGSGSKQLNNLGQKGQYILRDFVLKDGKGIVGICAGCYALSSTENYPCLGLSGVRVIERQHYNTGRGLVEFSLTEKGKELMPEFGDANLHCQYYDGPVMGLAPGVDDVEILAQYKYDHLQDSEKYKGKVVGQIFASRRKVGAGRVASVSGHPESTPGIRWMIPRMVRWACNKKLISYSKNVVRPEIYSQEIIFTSERAKKQSKYYNQLTGTTKQKIEAINGVIDMACWSAKKWVPGMLRDKDPKVRIAAANGLVRLERTDAIDDVKAALDMEIDPVCLKTLEQALKQLENIKG